MINDNLVWLFEWFNSQCDGDWEHYFQIKIETMDNPGWSIKNSIQETELQDKEFKEISIEKTEKKLDFLLV